MTCLQGECWMLRLQCNAMLIRIIRRQRPSWANMLAIQRSGESDEWMDLVEVFLSGWMDLVDAAAFWAFLPLGWSGRGRSRSWEGRDPSPPQKAVAATNSYKKTQKVESFSPCAIFLRYDQLHLSRPAQYFSRLFTIQLLECVITHNRRQLLQPIL